MASTNSFLKELAQVSVLENYTVVVTENQIQGRGQYQNSWHSEKGKNLTFSVFTSFKQLYTKHHKYLNFAVTLAIYETLFTHNIPRLSIKWPNDILSGNKKICGVLIENFIKGAEITASIIGIGLNVNQEIFPPSLPHAVSIKNCIKKKLSLDDLLKEIIIKLKEKITLLTQSNFIVLEQEYLKVLYKKNVPTMFKDFKNNLFIGAIDNISPDGKLQIRLENDCIKEYGIKEISIV